MENVENVIEAAPETTPQPAKVVKAGKPVRGEFNAPAQAQAQQQQAPAPASQAPGDTIEEKNAAAAAAPAAHLTLSDDQIKELLTSKGIVFEGGLDAIKEKFSAAPRATQTPEEIKATESAFEKRMLDHYLASDGTAEEFVALKQVASMDLTDLSVAELKRELKEKGFDADEIDLVLKERFYQINPDELEKDDEELDEEFTKRKELLKKKVAYGSEELQKRSLNTKKSAEDILSSIREAIQAEDLEKNNETQYSSKVEEYSKKISRDVTLELGKAGDSAIDPISYKVSDADFAETLELFKDPAKRQQFFFNSDKTLNYEKLMDVMLRNKYLESLAKVAYLESGNRQVAAFRRVFPGSPQSLGVGGASSGQNTGRPGTIVKAGKPELVRQQ